MKGKIQAGVVGLLIAAIGAFGVVETLQAAPPEGKGPKESQRLRGMEGRAFLVEATALQGPPAESGSYCYIFNSGGQWIDERFTDGLGELFPGTWEQHSVGAKTPYTVEADALFFGFVPISLIQEGVVTPARGKGVLRLEAITEVYAPSQDDFSQIVLVQILSTVGYEIDVNDCPSAGTSGD